MTSSSPDQITSTSRWKKYCADYHAFFDRHPVTHAIYSFCLLFVFGCAFQFFAAANTSLARFMFASTFYATVTTSVLVVVRYRAARKRRAEVHRDASSVI